MSSMSPRSPATIMSGSAATSTGSRRRPTGLTGVAGLSQSVRRADPPRLVRPESRQARRRQRPARPPPGRGGLGIDEERAAGAVADSMSARLPDERAAASRGDHPGDAAAAELHLAVVHGDDARRRSSIPAATCPGSRPRAAQAGVTIEKILLTHGHIDHCGSAGILAEELGVPIEGPHEDDRFWIDAARRGRRQIRRRRPPVRTVALARRRRPGHRRRADASTSATAPATRPATSSSTIRNRSSRWSATCCSRARSAAGISRAATSSS